MKGVLAALAGVIVLVLAMAWMFRFDAVPVSGHGVLLVDRIAQTVRVCGVTLAGDYRDLSCGAEEPLDRAAAGRRARSRLDALK